ncbi:S8 family serine peptidase, partial [Candidatus Poseidoniales archaeon]|nr:S8 family serine peptidase [Candidatus Poseidoniales archaeon]
MSRTSNSRLLTVFFLQFIFLVSLASPLAQGTNPYGDLDKMDSALEEALASNDDDSILHEVIFQLKSPVTSDDLDFIKQTGAVHLHEALLIDGGLIEAPSDIIRKISLWDRIEYLELNRELDFFYLPSEWGGPTDPGIMMHETTHVVRATDAWHRVIVDTDGKVAFETDLAFSEWDGDGTAIVDLDTGVDAGHPDFDYLEPWTGEKVIYSAKWDGVWTETTNSDTSSGHGTHVGGTIAGNGDASAGRRAGVSKGGQLVALGTGDGASI